MLNATRSGFFSSIVGLVRPNTRDKWLMEKLNTSMINIVITTLEQDWDTCYVIST